MHISTLIYKCTICLCAVLWLATGKVYAQSPPPVAEVEKEVTSISISAKEEVKNNVSFLKITFSGSKVARFTTEMSENILTIRFAFPVNISASNAIDATKEPITGILLKDATTLLLELKPQNYKIRRFLSDNAAGFDLITLPKTEKDIVVTKEKSPEPKKISIAGKVISNTPLGPPVSTEKKAPTKPKMIVEREKIGGGIRLMFPWKRKVSAAVFGRSNNLWVVFNEAQPLNTDAISGVKYFGRITQSLHPQFTILRLEINDAFTADKQILIGTLLRIRTYREENRWVIDITEVDPEKPSPGEIAKPIALKGDTSSLVPRIYLQTPEIGNALEIEDASVGDRLVIIPTNISESGVSPTREFIDFRLPETSQGIVLQKISDQLTYQVKRDGVEISSTLGLKLRRELYLASADELQKSRKETKRERIKKEVLPSDTVFPFKTPAPAEADSKEKNIEFIEKRREFNEAILAAEGNEKNNKRMDLAQYFFGLGLYPESLGVLNEITNQDPDFGRMQEVDLMVAAIKYLQGYYLQAVELFKTLADEAVGTSAAEELKLWQWASNNKLPKNQRKTDYDVDIDFIASFDRFLSKYPKEVRYDFGLLASKQFLEEGDLAQAKSVLEIISYEDIPPRYKNHTSYLSGEISEAEGDVKKAKEIWTKLSEDTEDRYNRARAKFALTKLLLVHGEITVEEAVKTFDKLGIVWRGDSFELELLKLIGQLYIKEKQYQKGLQAWRTLVTNFPNSEEALLVAGKMKRTFIRLFDEGEAYKLSPFEALSLYFEFRELTPVGERGDRIIRQLAEHFVKADLLENAAALILHQVRFRAVGEDKYNLALYLADLQMKNSRPDAALEALDFIEDDKASERIIKEKKYKKAQIMAFQGRYDDVLNLLEGDFSKGAQDARLKLFWDKKNWFGIINIVEERLPEFAEETGFPLTNKQTEELIQLAVAYATQEEREKLSTVFAKFNKRIENEKQKELFFYLTNQAIVETKGVYAETSKFGDIELFLTDYVFWPKKDWPNVAAALEPRVATLRRPEPPLTPKELEDILRLGIAYAMQGTNPNATQALSKLSKDFKDVILDTNTIQVMRILEDPMLPKIEDAIFEGKIGLAALPDFIKIYQDKRKFSEMNAALLKNQ